MKITTLIDNLVYPRNLLAEHGLSFYIEVGNALNQNAIDLDRNILSQKVGNNIFKRAVNKILFDCGQSSIFAQNAHNLGIDLKEIDTVIISHGHYDHTGGLERFLEINKTAKIYIKQEALLEKFNHGRYIGVPKELFNSEVATNQDLTSGNEIKIGRELIIDPERVVFPTEQITQICESLYLVSFPSEHNSAKRTNRANDAETTSAQNNRVKGFSVIENGKQIEDCFNDEQYLVYKNNNKLSLITGCSHRGILNIITLVEKLFKMPVCEIVGGIHTQKHSLEKIQALALELNKSSVQTLNISHCTGIEAFALLKTRLNAKTTYNYTGSILKSNI